MSGALQPSVSGCSKSMMAIEYLNSSDQQDVACCLPMGSVYYFVMLIRIFKCQIESSATNNIL